MGSLFSITLFSQGWLVAANVFDSREAKRLYGLLGLGAVAGAAIGSAVTTFTVKIVGTQNLILACAVMVLLAFGAFLGAVRQCAEPMVRARAADAEKLEFSARDIFSAVARYRHLQVIIAIILLTFIVDELVDFQFQAMAKHRFRGDQLTAFFGGFYVYLNLISLVLQLFFTAWVVRRVGVGGTLQIMPVSITVASLAAAAVPGLVSAVVLRFSEAVNRYTFNRTGMELLFLPLPSGLKNRTKAFVDIFVDRFGRGIAGILLAAMLWAGLRDMRIVAILTLVFTVTWILLARIAQRSTPTRCAAVSTAPPGTGRRPPDGRDPEHAAARADGRVRQRPPGVLCAFHAGGGAGIRSRAAAVPYPRVRSSKCAPRFMRWQVPSAQWNY